MTAPATLSTFPTGIGAASSGAIADRLLRDHRGIFGIDVQSLARDIGERAEPERLLADLGRRLSPVEQGQFARVFDASRSLVSATGVSLATVSLATAARAASSDAQRFGEAFRRELDAAPARLAASASPEAQRRYADLRQAGQVALLCSDVYANRSNPALLPRGVTAIGDAQAERQFPGFTGRNDAIGFYARVYRDANTDTFIVVNRGTNDANAVWGILTRTPDGRTNTGMIAGNKTVQATTALANARAVDDAADGRVRFAGHSLGGGLASLQAMRTGRPATVFNPLGINARLGEAYQLRLAALNEVRSFQVDGEPVARANRFLGLRTSTDTTVLASRETSWSANDGFRSSAGSDDPHSMVAVMGGVLHGMAELRRGR